MKTKEGIRTLPLTTGRTIPVLGQGTWQMGEDPDKREEEIAALRHGLDLGMNLIDTAEMYGEGAAEELIGEAIAGRRDEVFLVSKVYPHNATRDGAPQACERSLRRLRTDHVRSLPAALAPLGALEGDARSVSDAQGSRKNFGFRREQFRRR